MLPVPAAIGTDPVPAAASNDQAVIAPTVTVHDGAGVVVPALWSFDQVTPTSNAISRYRMTGSPVTIAPAKEAPWPRESHALESEPFCR